MAPMIVLSAERRAQLEAELREVETVYREIGMGRSIVSANHSNPSGSRGVTYRGADTKWLEREIDRLRKELGMVCRFARRPIAVTLR